MWKIVFIVCVNYLYNFPFRLGKLMDYIVCKDSAKRLIRNGSVKSTTIKLTTIKFKTNSIS